MKIKNLIVSITAVFFTCLFIYPLTIRASEAEEKEYRDFRAGLVELYNAGKYGEAAKLIEKNYDRFPSKMMNMSYNMALVCTHLKDYKKGVEYLKMAHERGQWFSIWAFEGDIWAPYREIEDFKKVLARNLEMKEAAQKEAKPKLEVFLPGNLEKGKHYPLFIALHGGGENIEIFKPQWKSETMEEEFIVAFVQSSQVSSMDGFSWQNQEITKKEVSEAFQKVCDQYPVDTAEVIVGGFSSGGYASLIVTFFDVIPVRGFVILCPPMPDNITEAEVIEAKAQGMRGTIITTELDHRVPDQRGMADLFKEVGFQYQFILTPNIGHWYPENLPELIDRAIAHIRSG